MPTATPNLAKNCDGRGPRSAMPNSVVNTSAPAMYAVTKNRRSIASETGRMRAPTVMMPPNQIESASTYT